MVTEKCDKTLVVLIGRHHSEDLIQTRAIYPNKEANEEKQEGWQKELIEIAKTQAIKLVESTLKQSNVDLIATYAFKGERSGPLSATLAVQNEIINPALTDAQVPSTKNPGLPITQVYQALLLIISYQVEEFRTALVRSRQFSVGEKMVPLICKDCNNISGLEMFVLSMTIRFGHCISLPYCRI